MKAKSGSKFHKSPDSLPSEVKKFSHGFLFISLGRIVEDGSHSPEERETAAITRRLGEKSRISAEKAGPFVTSDNGDKGSNKGG
jgi:hypothetical protein